jgi:hypothetical protein
MTPGWAGVGPPIEQCTAVSADHSIFFDHFDFDHVDSTLEGMVIATEPRRNDDGHESYCKFCNRI